MNLTPKHIWDKMKSEITEENVKFGDIIRYSDADNYIKYRVIEKDADGITIEPLDDPDWVEYKRFDELCKRWRFVMATNIIAGHELTLQPNRRYIASRPMASRKRRSYPVTIAPLGWEGESVTVDDLDYAAANRLVNAFNDGPISFDGRVW